MLTKKTFFQEVLKTLFKPIFKGFTTKYIFLLKSDPHLPKQIVISFTESPLKMIKNAFYFILKALLVLKIFKFLS